MHMDGPPVFAQVLCDVFALQSAFLETAAQFHVYVPLTYGLWKMKKRMIKILVQVFFSEPTMSMSWKTLLTSVNTVFPHIRPAGIIFSKGLQLPVL